ELQFARVLEHGGLESADLAADLLRCCRRAQTGANAALAFRALATAATRRPWLRRLARTFHHVHDGLVDAAWRDAMLEVVRNLLLAPPGRLGQRALDRSGTPVCIENGAAIEVARGATDGLDQRTF